MNNHDRMTSPVNTHEVEAGPAASEAVVKAA
jgi:hypothetical protein